MEGYKYKIEFDDGRMVPKNETLAYRAVKILIFVVAVILVLGSIVFGEFLLMDASFGTWGCLAVACVYFITAGGHKRERCHTELFFYDDYFVQYVPKHYYTFKKIKCEYYKMYYKDVKQCIYRSNVRKMDFFGIVEATFYDYNKDGTLQTSPSYHKTVDAITKFYAVFAPEINFVELVEAYTPLKVEIMNN